MQETCSSIERAKVWNACVEHPERMFENAIIIKDKNAQLVPLRLNSAQKRGHFKSVCATSCEERTGDSRLFFQPGMAFLVELPIAANSAAFDGLAYVIDFGPHEGRLVEWDLHSLNVNKNAHLGLNLYYIPPYER